MGSRKILPCVENSLDHENNEENNGQGQVRGVGSGLSEGFPENDIKSCMWAGGLAYQVMKKMILVANKRLPKPPQRHLEGSIYPSGFLQTHSSLQRNHVSSETP